VAKPLSVNVDTYGTGNIDEAELQEIMEFGGTFDFRPAAIIDDLGLLKPDGWSYRQTASYGHFGRSIFPWEKTDKAEVLKNILQTRRAARSAWKQAAVFLTK
jgi:S-adenosylmethionine synthetase